PAPRPAPRRRAPGRASSRPAPGTPARSLSGAPAGRAAPPPGETARTRGARHLPGRARTALPSSPWPRAASRAPPRSARPPEPPPPRPPTAGRTARPRPRPPPRPRAAAPRRSCGRWSCFSPRSLRLELRQVPHHQIAVGLAVELRLQQLGGRGDREIYRFTPQLDDGLLFLGVDLVARPLEQLLVLLARPGEQGLALFVGDRLRFGDQLLRLGVRRRGQAFMLGEQCRGFLSVPGRVCEHALKLLLPRPYGFEQRAPRDAA